MESSREVQDQGLFEQGGRATGRIIPGGDGLVFAQVDGKNGELRRGHSKPRLGQGE